MPRKNIVPHFIFGNLIRKYRLSKDLTQQQLAIKLNLNRSYLSALERGEKKISFDQVVNISKSIEISKSQVLSLFGL